jgi:hypothetical protein
MPLTQSEREHVGAVEVTCREEGTVVAEEAEKSGVYKEDMYPRTTPREDWSRSLSRNPSPREELTKSKDRRCRHHHLHRTWPT